LTLLVTTIEEIVQDLIKSLVSMEKGLVTTRSEDSTGVMSIGARTDQSTNSGTGAQRKRPPPSCGRALRHAAPEIDLTQGYIADLAAVLRQAVEMRNERQIRSYKRTLRKAMVRSKEIVTRTAQTQGWDLSLVASFMEDTDGFTSEVIKNADTTLRHLNQETLTRWVDSCAEQGGQIMNLTVEVYELLIPDTWMWEECNEHVVKINGILEKLGGLEEQFARDQLDAYQNYHEALKIQSDMNAESIEALRTIRCMAKGCEPSFTPDEEEEARRRGPDR
jgi:hypothetical protein